MKMSNTPLVSLLMTSYNRQAFIAEAIEAVLASDYKNFELHIVDDASTDMTVAIAKRMACGDKRIKIHINDKNLGQFPNRNHAADFAKGEYILYTDSDDTILPTGIRNLVTIMEANPGSGIGMYAPQLKEITVLQPQEAICKHFFEKPFLFHGPGGTILRRTFFDSLGRYPVEYGIPGDMYFNLKAASSTAIVLIPLPFMVYRLHDGQELNNQYDYLYNNYKYMRDALERLPLPIDAKQTQWLAKKAKRRFTVNIIKHLLSTRDLKSTRLAIRRAGFRFRDAVEGIFHF